MPAFVKDEKAWDKAQALAKAQGQAGNWAYVTGIYKRMRPQDFKKSATVQHQNWTVTLFSSSGRVLYQRKFPAYTKADADEAGIRLVKPVMAKYPDAEDWVVELAMPSDAQVAYARHLLTQAAKARNTPADVPSESALRAMGDIGLSNLISGLKEARGEPIFYGNGQFMEFRKRAAAWRKAPGKQNPRVVPFFDSWIIKFDHPRLADYMWTGSGLKPGIKMWSGQRPKEFTTQGEAEQELTATVLDHITQYKVNFAEFITGWDSGERHTATAMAPTKAGIIEFLKHLDYGIAGRAKQVLWSTNPIHPDWLSVEVTRPLREPWDEDEDWEATYAGPLRQRVTRALEDKFGHGVFSYVNVHKYGHLEIHLVPKMVVANRRVADTNQKVVEAPHNFHPVTVEPPKAKREKFPFEGFIDFQGLQIDVENKKGSSRSGTDPDGAEWSVEMFAHYGEIRGTEGTDGDKLDVYVGDNHDSSIVVVVHQQDPATGKFDEDKVMLGFDSVEEAIGAYKKQYDKPGYFKDGEYLVMPLGQFWRWVHDEKNQGKKVSASLRVATRYVHRRQAYMLYSFNDTINAALKKWAARWQGEVEPQEPGFPGEIVFRRGPSARVTLSFAQYVEESGRVLIYANFSGFGGLGPSREHTIAMVRVTPGDRRLAFQIGDLVGKVETYLSKFFRP